MPFRFKSEETQKNSVGLREELRLLKQRISEDLHEAINIVEGLKIV